MVLPSSASGATTVTRLLAFLDMRYPVPFAAHCAPPCPHRGSLGNVTRYFWFAVSTPRSTRPVHEVAPVAQISVGVVVIAGGIAPPLSTTYWYTAFTSEETSDSRCVLRPSPN